MNFTKGIIFCLFLALIITGGCKSTLTVTNRSDPQSFNDYYFSGISEEGFSQVEIEVPEEVSDEDFDIERTDIFTTAYLNSIFQGTVEDIDSLYVELYLGLEGGDENLDDPEINQILSRIEIQQLEKKYSLEFHDPRLMEKAIRQERFYIKARFIIRCEDVVSGILTINDIYFIAEISRETGGLSSLLFFL